MSSKSQKSSKNIQKSKKRSGRFLTPGKFIFLLLVAGIAGLTFAGLTSGVMAPYQTKREFLPSEPLPEEDLNPFVVPDRQPAFVPDIQNEEPHYESERDDTSYGVAPYQTSDEAYDDEQDMGSSPAPMRRSSPIDFYTTPRSSAPSGGRTASESQNTSASGNAHASERQLVTPTRPQQSQPAQARPSADQQRNPNRMSDRMERAFPSTPQNDSASAAARRAADVAKDVLEAEKLLK